MAQRDCVTASAWVDGVQRRSSGVTVQVVAEISDRAIVLGARSRASGRPAADVLVAFFARGCLVTSGRASADAVTAKLGGRAI